MAKWRVTATIEAPDEATRDQVQEWMEFYLNANGSLGQPMNEWEEPEARFVSVTEF